VRKDFKSINELMIRAMK